MNNFFNDKQNNTKSQETEYEKTIRIANALYPKMRDKKPNWNLSAIEPKQDKPKSFGGGIKIPDEKKETREEEITRWANALYPTMKDKEEPKEEKKKSPYGLGILSSKQNQGKMYLDEKDDNKIKGAATGAAAPLKEEEKKKQEEYLDKKFKDNFSYQNAIKKIITNKKTSDSKSKNVNKDKTLYDLEVEGETLEDLATSSANRIKENSSDNKDSILNAKKRDLSNEPYLFDSDFAEVLGVLFPIEGGYNNDKFDLGGPTNMGITQDTYDWYNKRHNIPKKDVKNITRDEAIKIYYDDYWKGSGASEIKDKKMALLYFDTAVNMGPGIARRFYDESNGNFDEFMKMRRNRYSGIIEDIPNQKANKKGWENRLRNLQEYIDTNY